ncbi:MAG: nucleotidyltransferase [Verrucomicrobia bacterium]|nr:nucleotidyltransferase [Verrucomicrobiota bacterium]
MTITDVALLVIDALDRAGVAHMLVGSFSSNYHGIPRSTEDVDFVVKLAAPLASGFDKLLGENFEADPQLSFETNTGTVKQVFRVKDSEFKVEIFRLSDDPFDQERFRRRQLVEVKGRRVFMPSAEDVVVMKLRWKRKKDLEDVKDVLSVQGGKLDWLYVEKWCDQHDSRAVLEEIRKTVPAV